MYRPCDSEFLAGQAFAGMPFGFNPQFDAFRRAPHAWQSATRQPVHSATRMYDVEAAIARTTPVGCDF